MKWTGQFQALADAPSLTQLPGTMPGKAVEDCLSVWVLAVHVGDPNGVPGFLLQLDPDLLSQPYGNE